MSLIPSVIKVGSTLTIHLSGRMYTIDQTVKNYQTILEICKNRRWEELQEQLDIAVFVAKRSGGKAEVIGDTVHLDGVPVKHVIAERIIDMLREGWDVSPMLRFLENVARNPADYAIKELYLFLETNRLPITEDGHFLAYKVVNNDYMDKYTRTIRNRVGDTPEMDRTKVDPNRNNTCSVGLHFCSRDYISAYGDGRDRLMLVKINPADVVSIPADYKNTKGRCWRYEVVDEIPFGAKDKVDASSPACVNTEDVTKDYVPSEVEKRVVLILAEQMAHDPKTIHLGTTVDQLGADSLDAIEIQMAMEDSFEIEFAEGDIERMRTVGELVRFIESKSAQTQGDDTPMTNLVPEGREDDRFAKFLLAEVIRGEDLKNLREELNISGTVLATELGVSRSSVWSFENSNHPKRETVERAVTALKAIASRS